MKIIAVTFVCEPNTYGEVWENYYSKWCDNVMQCEMTKEFKQSWDGQVSTMNSVQNDLFKEYDCIVMTDVDEILIPNPRRYSNLRQFIERDTRSVVRSTGYNLMEMPGDDPLDLNESLFMQRTHWNPDSKYSKYNILKERVTFVSPHEISSNIMPDSDLTLVHLRDADHEGLRMRMKEIGRKVDEQDLNLRQAKSVKIPLLWRKFI